MTKKTPAFFGKRLRGGDGCLTVAAHGTRFRAWEPTLGWGESCWAWAVFINGDRFFDGNASTLAHCVVQAERAVRRLAKRLQGAL